MRQQSTMSKVANTAKQCQIDAPLQAECDVVYPASVQHHGAHHSNTLSFNCLHNADAAAEHLEMPFAHNWNAMAYAHNVPSL